MTTPLLNASLDTPHLEIPDPDAIRAAIDAADERARLLRRLLRVSIMLRDPAGHQPARRPASRAKAQEAVGV